MCIRDSARTLLSIGRDPSNDLVLPDALVSRRHAVIECRGSQYVMRDCNSSNGSLVNGDRISEHQLKDGDLLAIGTARLLFRETEIEEPAAKVVLHPSAPRLQCPGCQSDYRRGDQFCRKCGQALPAPAPMNVTCSSCGANVPLPANFCNSCGAPIARAEDGLEPTRPRARAEVALAPEPSASPSAPSPEAAPLPAEPVASPVVSPSPVPPVTGSAAPMVALPPAPRPSALTPRPRPMPSPVRAPSLLPSAWMADTPPAAFGPRLAAAAIDALIVAVAQAALVAPGAFYFSRMFGTDEKTLPAEPGFLPILLSVALVVVAALIGAGYYVYFWGVKGATPGKRFLGLVVQSESGEVPIGVGRAVLRLLGYVLSGAVLGIGFLMIAFSGDGLHDRLASTRVVRAPGPRS